MVPCVSQTFGSRPLNGTQPAGGAMQLAIGQFGLARRQVSPGGPRVPGAVVLHTPQRGGGERDRPVCVVRHTPDTRCPKRRICSAAQLPSTVTPCEQE